MCIRDSYKDVKFEPKNGGNDFSIKVFKKNENGKGLAGAEFDVVKNASGDVVGKITTDADGNGHVANLAKDNYTLREKMCIRDSYISRHRFSSLFLRLLLRGEILFVACL